MSLYLDTSLLVTLLTNETETVASQDWLRARGHENFSISDWTLTEFSAALSIKLRTGALDVTARLQVLRAFNDLRRDSFGLIAVVRAHYDRAARMADRYETGLRAGDALHLAIAEAHGAAICTRDAGLADACAAFGCKFELI